MIRYPDTAPLPEPSPKRDECDGRSHQWEQEADEDFKCSCGAAAQIVVLKDGWERITIFQPPQRLRCEHGNWSKLCAVCALQADHTKFWQNLRLQNANMFNQNVFNQQAFGGGQAP